MANFQRVYSHQVGNKILEPGMEFTVVGERAKLRYVCTVTNLDNDQTWVDCFEIHNAHARSIRPERINPRSIKVPKKPRKESK
jgi:hypothetical protein